MVEATYHLPDLLGLCPKTTKGISPHLAEADAAWSDWMDKFSLFSDSDRDGWRKMKVPLLAALVYPHASAKELSACITYMRISAFLEVMTDDESSVIAQQQAQMFVEAFQDPAAVANIPHLFAVPMSSATMELRDALGPLHWPGFIDCNIAFAKGVVREVEAREDLASANHAFAIQSYISIRRETIGVKPCFALTRYVRHVVLPDDVLNHPLLEEMLIAAVDMVFLSNDLYSYKREIAANGAPHNILTIIMRVIRAQFSDLQIAIDHTTDLFRDALARFQRCRALLPSFGEETDRMVSDYADGLMDWIIGNIEWSLANGRYAVYENDEDREKGILKLPVGEEIVCSAFEA